MKHVLRSPGLHYLVLGALLFAARASLPSTWSESPRILVTAARRGEIRREFKEQSGRFPTAEEERAHVERAVDDEILYREALARGLDRDNPVVRERVVQSMRLLSDDPQTDDATLYREGLRMGLDRSDVVVRRHLATTMRLLAVMPARLETPSDAELLEVLAREGDRFQLPAATSITHVFVGFGLGRERADRAAGQLLDELRGAHVDPARAPERGEPFPLGFRLARRTDADLDALFGRGFAAGIAALPLAAWGGPIASTYGLHLVWVHERLPARTPPLDSLRSRLVERVHHLRRDQRLHEWLAQQRARYAVDIAEESQDPRTLLRSAALPAESLALPRPAAFIGD